MIGKVFFFFNSITTVKNSRAKHYREILLCETQCLLQTAHLKWMHYLVCKLCLRNSKKKQYI